MTPGSGVEPHILDSVIVFRQIFSCSSSSANNILQCNSAVLLCRLRQQGLEIGSSSDSVARRMLTYHLIFGMCCSGRGDCCTSLANGARQRDAALSVLENVTPLCRSFVIHEIQLRFICSAVSLTLWNDINKMHILTHMNSTAMFFCFSVFLLLDSFYRFGFVVP